MSIWGKISGGAAGLLAGGPLGAALGALAGHLLVDRPASAPGGPADPGIAFTIAMIALGAKMAKSDGVATGDEEEAFRQYFRVPPSEEANVRRIFRLARQDTAGFESYARQIANIYRGNPPVLEDILDGLVEIAKADGGLHACELSLLYGLVALLDCAPNEFRRIHP